MEIKLADALLRRKELQEKVKLTGNFRNSDLYTTKVKRVKVSDGIDEVTADIPTLELNEVTAELDFYSQQLRKIDAVIQQANWATDVSVDNDAMSNYDESTSRKNRVERIKREKAE
jgi:hypothetical protein